MYLDLSHSHYADEVSIILQNGTECPILLNTRMAQNKPKQLPTLELLFWMDVRRWFSSKYNTVIVHVLNICIHGLSGVSEIIRKCMHNFERFCENTQNCSWFGYGRCSFSENETVATRGDQNFEESPQDSQYVSAAQLNVRGGEVCFQT